jgi:hypothetical protein
MKTEILDTLTDQITPAGFLLRSGVGLCGTGCVANFLQENGSQRIVS